MDFIFNSVADAFNDVVYSIPERNYSKPNFVLFWETVALVAVYMLFYVVKEVIITSRATRAKLAMATQANLEQQQKIKSLFVVIKDVVITARIARAKLATVEAINVELGVLNLEQEEKLRVLTRANCMFQDKLIEQMGQIKELGRALLQERDFHMNMNETSVCRVYVSDSDSDSDSDGASV